MKVFPWLAGLWLLCAAFTAAAAPLQITSTRSWQAPEGDYTFARAREVLDAMPATPAVAGEDPQLRVQAGRATWLAVTLPELPRSWVLELTHPSLRLAELYVADGDGTPVGRTGLDIPVAERLHQRFPATLALPRAVGVRTVYVRVLAAGPAHAHIVLAPQGQWELQSRLSLAGMTLGFAIAGLAALYALVLAAAQRSGAYLAYALLTLVVAAWGLVMTGLGEAHVWPFLAPWRGQTAALLACVASGLALLLLERAFALELSTPGFAGLLRLLGFGLPLLGAAALTLPPATQQMTAYAAVGLATLMGIASLWMALRTHNRSVVWLLLGYVPVLAGAGLATQAIAGALPFEAWALMVLPFTGMLQIPFQLHGLRVLEHRRAEVRRNRRQLVQIAGHQEESRDDIGKRLALPPQEGEEKPVRATVLLLRFVGLTPGRSVLREHDNAVVERYLQAMMASALRPGGQVGRWSFHEIVVRDTGHESDAEIEGYIVSLFARARRSTRYGIPAREPDLRIAFVRVYAPQIPVMQLTRRLSRALDDPAQREERWIEIEGWED